MQPAKVTGVIPRIEDRTEQLEFARKTGMGSVMMDMYRAERLLEKGETAESLFPDATVILTTTFEDERLEFWFLERQIEVAVAFGADMVIPCDCPVYRDDPQLQRRQTIEVYTKNLTRAFQEFGEYGITVIPLVKGETPKERRICYETFQQAGVETIAHYCAQYFLYGVYLKQLQRRVRDIVSEFEPENMLLIGFQSENYLSQFPPAVTAAAGRRWFRKAELAEESMAVAQRNYADWKRQADEALRGGQTMLDSFIEQPVYGGN